MLAEGQQLSHYRIVSLLKSGGMGEVYLAVDTHLNRQVAIKVINTDALHYAEIDAAKDAARLFLREAQAIAQLDQTNILPLYDSGEQVVHGISLMFMVMPYRQAGSLADWKRSHFGNQLLPLAAVERIVEQAALALQHAHDRRIIHQDVKPSNFLVQGNANTPNELHLQLADFGVAKVMMMSSESQVIRGTPTYMAPEQWEGHPVPATDQYALAVMAYELLTGRPPFVGNGYQQMWHQHVHLAPSPPSKINPALPKELDTVMLRALEKHPERRYSSVLAFSHAFQRAVLNGGNIYQTLIISALEARTGTNRVLPLSNGRHVIVPVPPGVTHGQIIRLEGYGRPTTYNHPVGALIVTISISPVISIESAPPTTPTFQHTMPAASSLARNEAKPSLPPVPQHKQHSSGNTKLHIIMAVMAFLMVLLAGLTGLYVVILGKADSKNIPYPSYLPGNGTFAAFDSLKNADEGNNWAQTPSSSSARLNGNCQYVNNALYATVNGQTGATFHPCTPAKTSSSSYPLIYSNFAYQIKMTIVTGDCGGVTFRQQGEKFYYFFICQNSNYPCHLNSDQACNYSLIRYTHDSPLHKPDFVLNPMVTEGYSPLITQGDNQQYTISVVARGTKLDFYVNDPIQHIAEVSDNNYITGTIGVLAKTVGTDTTKVAFSDATMWTFS